MAEQDPMQLDEGESGTAPMNPPALITQPHGLLTSSGQLTAVVSLFCMIMAAVGYHFTPDQINGWADAVEHWATIATPIVTMLIAVFNFTNSRGKITSNTANANATIQAAALMGSPKANAIAGTAGGILSNLGILHNEGSGGSIQGSILGGKNWNDPQRYENIIADVIPLLGGLFHKKKVSSPNLTPDEQATLDALLKKAQ